MAASLVAAACTGTPPATVPSMTVAIAAPAAQPEPEPPPIPAETSAETAPSEASPTTAEAAAPSPHEGWLGVELESNGRPSASAPDAPLPDPGVLVTRVVPHSPAERAGLAPGDVIQRLDNEAMSTPTDVKLFVTARGPGARIAVALKRRSADRLFAVTLAPAPNGDEIYRMSYVDRPAPAFDALRTAKGSLPPTIAAQRGSVVVVEFWKPYCIPCRALTPRMNQWHAAYAARGFRVIGITTEPVARAAAAAAEAGMDYSIFADETGPSPTFRAYGVTAAPTVFVIDRAGTVRDVMVGYDAPHLAKLDKLVPELLAER